MDKYRRVEKPKSDLSDIRENEVRITTQGKMRNYISYATNLLSEQGEKQASEIILKAMGRAINKTVTIAEIIKRRIPGLHQITQIDSTDITDVWEPLEQGLDRVVTTRHVSSIQIILSTKQLDTNHVGYQPPLPADQVKPASALGYDMEPRQRRGRGRGRGRGGRGRGRGRGGIIGDSGIPQGVPPPQQPSGIPQAMGGDVGIEGERRGRGGRRGGGRGRGRGGRSDDFHGSAPAPYQGQPQGQIPQIPQGGYPGNSNNNNNNNNNNNGRGGFGGGRGRGGRGGRGGGRGRGRGRGGFRSDGGAPGSA